jgi:hypothetical protein
MSLTSLVHRISPRTLSSSHAFSATSPRSASDLPNQMELQINSPRLQMLTSSSADLASLRYLCVIATEASNLLPLFYRSLPIPILTPYPRFVLPIRGYYHAGMLAVFHIIPFASLNSTVLLCGSG